MRGVGRSLLGALVSTVVLAGLLVLPLLGQPTPESIDIKSDDAVVDAEGKKAVFSGNVLLRRGDWILTCNELVLTYATADDGSPVVVEARSSGALVLAGPEMRAEAQSGVLDWEQGTVVLTGEPTLRRGDNVVRATSITVNLESEKVELKGVEGRFRLEDLSSKEP